MDTIAFIVGLLAVTIYLLGYLQKERKNIILLNVTSRVLYVTQYFLLGAIEGAALDIAGIGASAVAQKKELPFVKKHRKLFFAGVNLMIVGVGLLSYKNLTSLLPVIGVLLHTSAFWFSDEKLIRWVSILGCPFWLSYDLISGAYGSAIGDFLSIISLAVSMLRYDYPGILSKNK